MSLRDNIIFVLFLLISSNINSQTISSIKIEGGRNFSEDNITKWCGVGVGDKIFPGMIDSIKANLALQFGNHGYFHSSFQNTRLEKIDSTHYQIRIDVDENNPTYVKNIIISGLDSISYKKIFQPFNFMEGNILDKYHLEENINNTLTYFENNGYPFAKIIISSIYFYADSAKGEYLADIYLKPERGILCKIDRIEAEGNISTKDYVILRELRINTGQLYSQKVIDELPNKLNSLGFFEPVKQPEFFLNSKNEGVLRINVKEKQTNNFDGIIGYIPPANPSVSGYLTGLVNISLRNIFGTGRAASIKWQQYDMSSQNLEIKYLEPWLFNYPFNLTASILQRKQDSTYVQRQIEGSLEYLATENISASLFLSTEAVIPTDNGTSAFTVFNSTSVTSGIDITIDTRDDPLAPTQGILFENAYSFSRKRINGPQLFITSTTSTNINLQRFSIDLSGYYQLFNKQVIALGLHGRELRGSFFEVSDLFRLGGANTLRGYREDQFLGNRITWTNFEYRLLLTHRTFGFVFFDTGYYLRNADIQINVPKSEGFNIGYGVGFNVETSLGVLRVSFALAKGDSFSQGKIHFGIVNEF